MITITVCIIVIVWVILSHLDSEERYARDEYWRNWEYEQEMDRIDREYEQDIDRIDREYEQKIADIDLMYDRKDFEGKMLDALERRERIEASKKTVRRVVKEADGTIYGEEVETYGDA